MASEEKPTAFLPHQPNFLAAHNEAAVGGSLAKNVESPLFNKRKILMRMPPNCSGMSITHMSINKNLLVCILNTPPKLTLLRFQLPAEQLIGNISWEREGYEITKIFLDPTGQHLLMSRIPKTPGLSADFLYVHRSGPRERRIEKFKDHEITAVAFNSTAGTESTTGSILLGTSRGLIFETELGEADKPLSGKQVYDLGLGRQKYPITALEVLRIPSSSKYVLVATSPSCVYTFQDTLRPDEKSLQGIFTNYVNGTLVCGTIKAPTDLNHSVLRFYKSPGEKYPKQWGWLNGTELRVGKVSKDIGSSTILTVDTVISLELADHKHERRQTVPKNFILTEYHALLLYADHIRAVCLLNQEVVFEEYVHEQHGKLLNMLRDTHTGEIYLYTCKTVFNLRISNESRNIWQIYLKQGLYDDAEFHSIENPVNFEIVRCERAKTAFNSAQYENAADIYAETGKAFEEICLKFLELDDKRPLIRFVRNRIKKMAQQDAEKAIIPIVWLINLYLTEITRPANTNEMRTKWQQEFDLFLREESIAKLARENRTLIQKLIAEHADAHNLSQFAIANEDYAEVIKQKLNAKKYVDALAILRTQSDSELFYRYCPALIEHLPAETIEVMKGAGRRLNFSRLVPSLLAIEIPQVEQIINYLEYCIFKLTVIDEAAHNFLLRLYAEHRPQKVIGYLDFEGQDETLVHYDLLYALSVFTDFELKEACVFVQRLLQMWSTAVDLALSFNIELAKLTASKPPDESLRRKLWLRIAYHEIKGTNDVQKALKLLQECKLLRIEDLLPFFSDFEKIDDFKGPICQALEEYNHEIQELQHEMEDCAKQAERVQQDLQNVREHRVRIETHATCTICEQFLLVRPFLIFGCGHKFHSDCLELVVSNLCSENSRELASLKQQLSQIADSPSSQQRKTREKLKLRIEQILAADCYYCCLLVDSIAPTFDWEKVNVDWE